MLARRLAHCYTRGGRRAPQAIEAVVKTVSMKTIRLAAASRVRPVLERRAGRDRHVRPAQRPVKDGRLRPDDQWMIAMAPDGRQLASLAQAGERSLCAGLRDDREHVHRDWITG
jgi:hypothetical protein